MHVLKALALFGNSLMHHTIIMQRHNGKVEEDYKYANVYLQIIIIIKSIVPSRSIGCP